MTADVRPIRPPALAVRHLGQGRKGVAYEVREEQCETAARRLSQGVLDFGEEVRQ